MTEFREWTPEIVKAFIVEAAQTLKIVPKVSGPKQYGNSMPDIVYDAWDIYGRRSAGYRLTASAKDLSNLERVERWINALESAQDRHLIRAWATAKASRTQKIRKFANENGMTTDILRHRILKISKLICEQLNVSRSILLTIPPLHLAEDEPETAHSDLNGTLRHHGIAVHREPGAIPSDRDPQSPDRLALVERLSRAVPRSATPANPDRKRNPRHKKRSGSNQPRN